MGCGNGCGNNWAWIIIILLLLGGFNGGGCNDGCGCNSCNSCGC